MEKIKAIAAAHDADIIWGRDRVALLGRIYDAEGINLIRHWPDEVDFHPTKTWAAMTAEEAARAVC